jgi:hypothetical protein
MDSSITVDQLSAALKTILRVNGVARVNTALEVIEGPNYGIRLFVVIPSQRARGVLSDKLKILIGKKGLLEQNVWILNETDSCLILQSAGKVREIS